MEKLRTLDPQVLVAIATADIQKSTWELAEAAGAAHLFYKPFDWDNILSGVAKLLERVVE